ncbi:MAG: hypothetical protein QOJ53_1429 [Sphingomonadales bacterium]|jgi:hypothetical protein|nr:hypothetical protein [Sphingomonadales bacterium]MEA3047097.1 hypothetical protein [Sphingomonadales bacterium]
MSAAFGKAGRADQDGLDRASGGVNPQLRRRLAAPGEIMEKETIIAGPLASHRDWAARPVKNLDGGAHDGPVA